MMDILDSYICMSVSHFWRAALLHNKNDLIFNPGHGTTYSYHKQGKELCQREDIRVKVKCSWKILGYYQKKEEKEKKCTHH